MKTQQNILTLIALLFFGSSLQAQEPGQALNFDGVDDFVNCGAFLTKSYTKEAWIKLELNNGLPNNIISGDAGHAFWAPSAFGYKVSAGHNYTWDYVQDPHSIEEGWQHYAVTYDADSKIMQLFKNGKLVDKKLNVPTFISTGAVLLGSYKASNLFRGTMDEVRIWNYARKESEILDKMHEELMGTETGLIAYYKFNEGNAGTANTDKTRLHDYSGNSNDGTLNNFALNGLTSNWLASGAIAAIATKNVPMYKHRFVQGRNVYVKNDALATDKKAITEEAIELLDAKLAEIDKMDMKAEAKALIKSVPFFMDWNTYPDVAALYNTSEQLKNRNLGEEKALSVYIVNINNFLDWTKTNQPYLVLHELAHAYHHYIGNKRFYNTEKSYNDTLSAAYNKKKADITKYREIPRFLGDTHFDQVKAYALKDSAEYFAEITEAYFGENDHFPFTRNQLVNYDPESHALVAKIWQGGTVTIPSETFDETKYYYLTTKWKGDGMVLDVINDDEDNKLRLVAKGSSTDTGQYWKISKAGNVYYRLTTKWLGRNKSLTGRLLDNTQGKTSQYWKITKVGDYFRLTNMESGTEKSLDVEDGTGFPLRISNNNDLHTGQYWKLTPITE